MSLSQPDLLISVELEDCSSLVFSDTTGAYNSLTNPLGYGLPGGIAVNDVVDVSLTLRYSKLESNLVYVFTVINGVIQTATLSFAGGTAVSILASLPSTVFPIVDFDLTADYGVEIPDFDDDVFKVTYVISGGTPEAFEYTTIGWEPVICNSRNAVDTLWFNLDLSCDCDNGKLKAAEVAESYIKKFEVASERGDLTKALDALESLVPYTEDSNCGC